MAQIPYRGNTQGMTFPLLVELAGQAVINPGQDQTYYPQVSADGGAPTDRGIPGAIYAHNVMPSTYGWQSVGYVQAINPPDVTTGLKFRDAFLIFGGFPEMVPNPDFDPDDVVDPENPIPEQIEQISASGYKTFIAIAKSGANGVYIVDPSLNKWVPAPGAPTNITDDTILSVATVNGVSYMYFSNIGCYIYNDGAGTLQERTLKGLDKTAITYIVSANGYLIAISPKSNAWSSSVNVEDFEPSDISGAGGGQVQEAKGELVCAVATSLGYILYTQGNAVSVSYSGNEDFPWNFKNIVGSGGVSSSDQVSRESQDGYQHCWTTSGYQQIAHTRCNTTLPAVTDFLAGKVFEDFDIFNNTFTRSEITWNMRIRMATIVDRYAVISYGKYPDQDFTHAIVIDTVQNRLGKLRITHTSCFERISLDPGVVELPRDAIALLQGDGKVMTVDFTFQHNTEDAVLMLGKFQFVRNRLIEIQEIDIENAKEFKFFQLFTNPSINGKSLATEDWRLAYQDVNEGDYRRFYISGVGKNITVMLKGTFNLVSYEMQLNVHGRV